MADSAVRMVIVPSSGSVEKILRAGGRELTAAYPRWSTPSPPRRWPREPDAAQYELGQDAHSLTNSALTNNSAMPGASSFKTVFVERRLKMHFVQMCKVLFVLWKPDGES